MTTTATTLRFDIKLPRLGYSLNARVHWSERARVTKLLRQTAWAETWHAQNVARVARANERRYLQLHVVWPRTRKGPLGDSDNVVSALKPVCDGIFAAGALIDDSPKWCDYRKPTQEKGSHTGYVLVRAEVGPV